MFIVFIVIAVISKKSEVNDNPIWQTPRTNLTFYSKNLVVLLVAKERGTTSANAFLARFQKTFKFRVIYYGLWPASRRIN